MHMSYFINRVKARLGAAVHGIELTNEALVDLFKEETLHTMSVYFPRKIGHKIDAVGDLVEGYEGRYYLKTPHTVVGVESVVGDWGATGSYPMMDAWGVVDGSIFDAQPAADIASAYSMPYIPEFIPPNQVDITPNPSPGAASVLVQLHVRHDTPMTLHPGLREKLAKLFEYDVKIDILGIRKYFQNLGTTFGEINLDLGTFEEAESRRDELLELFSTKKVHSSNRRKVYVA